MPYVTDSNRDCVDDAIDVVLREITRIADDDNLEGIVNYTVTRICNDAIINKKPRYKKINQVLGVLEAVKLEFYRRLAANYEDEAKEKNGDLFCYRRT